MDFNLARIFHSSISENLSLGLATPRVPMHQVFVSSKVIVRNSGWTVGVRLPLLCHETAVLKFVKDARARVRAVRWL